MVSSHDFCITLFLDHVWKNYSLPESPILRESIACSLPCVPCFCFWAKHLCTVTLTWFADSDFLVFLSEVAYTHGLTHRVLVFVHTAAGRCLSRSPGRQRIIQEGKASGTVGRPSSWEEITCSAWSMSEGVALTLDGAYQLGKEHFFGRGQKRGSV